MKKSAIKRWLCFPTGYFYFSPTGRDTFDRTRSDSRQATTAVTRADGAQATRVGERVRVVQSTFYRLPQPPAASDAT